jgi:hypothetical protein
MDCMQPSFCVVIFYRKITLTQAVYFSKIYAIRNLHTLHQVSLQARKCVCPQFYYYLLKEIKATKVG